MVETFLSAVLLVLAAEQAPPPKPGFKSNVTVVEVDVVAIDRSGRPVRGLRAEDFEISEDGSRVEVATFSAIDAPETQRQSTFPPPDRSGSAFASNDRPDDGRLILIVLDDIQVSFSAGRMATVKSVARRAVERLGPADVAGVMTTSGWLGGQAEFTTDKSRLLDAIERFVPRGEHDLPAIAGAPPSVSGVNPQADRLAERRTQSAMAGLSTAARALATIPHRRKGVLLISQGFPATLEDIIRNPIIGAGYESIREFMLTAQRSNVAVYTVDPCGLEIDAMCSRESRQNLRTIAELTGGFAVTDSNAPEAAVDRMLAENGTYYLVGYYSPAPPNDGKHHRINVRTRVADVEIRGREGYDSPGKAAKELTATPLDVLTRSAIQTRGLTMRVIAIPAPLSIEPSAAVIVGIEVPTEVATRAGRIAFAVVAIDQEGKTRSRVRFTTNFAASEKTPSPWTRTGSRIDLSPGQYQIRVAATGGDGLQGSVFVDVSVPKFDTDLGVGGLSLGAPSSIGITEADRLRGVLPLIPLATNEVAPRAAVSAQLPIRVSSKAASNPLTIAATLVREDGTTLPLGRTQAAGRDYAGAAGRVYRVALPQGLVAGHYRVTVESTLGRTTVAREVAFSVSAPPAGAQSPAPWRDPSPHQVRFVTVDSTVRLEVLDWGDSGRPVVFVGCYLTGHVYDNIAPKLTDRFHVYAVTRRGIGASDHPAIGYSPQRRADDILDVIDALKMQKPILVGNSCGGDILHTLGARNPERIGGLMYLDAAEDPTLTMAEYEQLPIDRAHMPARKGAPDTVPFPEAEVRQLAEWPIDPVIRRAIVEDNRVKPDYAHIRVPVVAIYRTTTMEQALKEYPPKTELERAALTQGYAASRAMLSKWQRDLLAGVPNAKVVELPGANLYMFLSNEADIIRELRAFATSLPAQPGAEK